MTGLFNKPILAVEIAPLDIVACAQKYNAVQSLVQKVTCKGVQQLSANTHSLTTFGDVDVHVRNTFLLNFPKQFQHVQLTDVLLKIDSFYQGKIQFLHAVTKVFKVIRRKNVPYHLSVLCGNKSVVRHVGVVVAVQRSEHCTSCWRVFFQKGRFHADVLHRRPVPSCVRSDCHNVYPLYSKMIQLNALLVNIGIETHKKM